jgi:acetyl esterase/lipase
MIVHLTRRLVMKAQALVVVLAWLGCAVAVAAQPLSTSVVQTYPIWPGPAPGMVDPPATEPPPNDRGSYVGVVRPTLVMSLAAHSNGAAVLILSGGSYKKVVRADTDGRDVARWLNGMGIDAYVLKYRLPMETFNPPQAAYQDAQRALRLIRANAFAGEFGHRTDPARIGVIGFSAGGHLAGVMGTYYGTAFYPPVDDTDRISSRPDFMILVSAPIYSAAYLQVRTRTLSVNGVLPRPLQVAAPYPFDTAVNAQTPPAIIFHGQLDDKVPYAQAIAAAGWLEKAKVPVELHIFPDVGHGASAKSDDPVKKWMPLCITWLKARAIIPAEGK